MNSLNAHSGGQSKPWAYLPQFAEETLPRFTSYPPANRFDASVGPRDFADALNDLPDNATLSLYLHIPFCRQLCWYCGCHTSVPTRTDPVDTYLTALKQEIGLIARAVPHGTRLPAFILAAAPPTFFHRIRSPVCLTSFTAGFPSALLQILRPSWILAGPIPQW